MTPHHQPPHLNAKCTMSFSKDFVGCAIAATLPWSMIQQLFNPMNRRLPQFIENGFFEKGE
jgi:hypothetical protein